VELIQPLCWVFKQQKLTQKGLTPLCHDQLLRRAITLTDHDDALVVIVNAITLHVEDYNIRLRMQKH